MFISVTELDPITYVYRMCSCYWLCNLSYPKSSSQFNEALSDIFIVFMLFHLLDKYEMTPNLLTQCATREKTDLVVPCYDTNTTA